MHGDGSAKHGTLAGRWQLEMPKESPMARGAPRKAPPTSQWEVPRFDGRGGLGIMPYCRFRSRVR